MNTYRCLASACLSTLICSCAAIAQLPEGGGVASFTVTSDGSKMGPDFYGTNLPRHFTGLIKPDPEGHLVAEGLRIIYMPNFRVVDKYNLTAGEGLKSFYFSYPPLRSSMIVPAYGRLYSVSFAPPNTQGKVQTVQFELEKSGFQGITLDPESFQVPLTVYSNVRCSVVRGQSIYVVDIETEPKSDKVTASIYTPNYSVKAKPSCLVSADDILMIGNKGHRVISVVPRDEKTGVIGWVEFAAEPLSADAIKAKGWGDRPVTPVTPVTP